MTFFHLGVADQGNMKPEGAAAVVAVVSTEVVRVAQDIPFPSLQITRFEGCYSGDPQGLKKAAMCGAVEKETGNLLCLKCM